MLTFQVFKFLSNDNFQMNNNINMIMSLSIFRSSHLDFDVIRDISLDIRFDLRSGYQRIIHWPIHRRRTLNVLYLVLAISNFVELGREQ